MHQQLAANLRAELSDSKLRVTIRSHLTALALFLCGIVAIVWVLEAFAVALHDSHDSDWGPARALLQGLDPYKLYLRCTPCRQPPFLPPVAPMYPASGLILLWPLAMLPWPTAKAAWAIFNLIFGAGLIITLSRLFFAGRWVAFPYLRLNRSVRGSPVSYES
jgi:hypothetical protein